MGILLILLGLHPLLLPRRERNLRAFALGAGLALAGVRELLDEATRAHDLATWATLLVLSAALVLACRDGTLVAVYRCRRRGAADPAG